MRRLGFTSHQGFMLALASASSSSWSSGMVFKAVTAYATYRFAMMRSYTISSRMLNGYLSQPYTWFLDRHSAGLGAAVLGEVQKVVTTALLPAMKFLTVLVTSVALIALLVVVRPGVALVAAGLIGGVYALLYAGVRQRINRMGKERHELNEQRFRIVGEAFGGMKDVKLLGLEGYFVDRFRRRRGASPNTTPSSMILREVPRYVIEGVAFGGLVGFILYLLVTGDGSFGGVMPILSLFAFTAIRLFPALQQIYGSLGQMRFAAGTLDKLHKDFVGMAARTPTRPPPGADAPALHLTERLELEDVHYAYPQAERPAVAGPEPRDPGAEHRRHRRRHRGRQDHDGRHHARAARCPTGARSRSTACRSRRDEHARLAALDRLRAAADLPDRRHGLGQHRLRARGRRHRPGGGRAGGADRRAARLRHARAAGGLRHQGRRARGAALGRAAAAHRHRPRALPRSRRADPRRGDERARQPDRAGGDGRGPQPRPRQDHRDDRAPALDRARLRHDLHARAAARWSPRAATTS